MVDVRKYILVFVLVVLCGVSSLFSYEIFPVEVTKQNEILFQIDYASAKKVTLAGSFNSWDKDKLILKKDELGIWKVAIKLTSGKYEYKFVINDKEWIPSDNLNFEIVSYQGRLILKGGKGYSVLYEKKSNLKVSDSIFLNGYYKFISIPFYNFDTKRGGVLQNRHILKLMPHIFINENVFLDTSLALDTLGGSMLSLWQAKFALHTGALSLLLFNNYRVFYFLDALRSLDEYIYSSDYQLFQYPIELYNSKVEEREFGYNYRGVAAQFLLDTFDVQGFYVHPIFYNFDVSGGSVKKEFGDSHLSFIYLLKRGIYEGDNYANIYETDKMNSPFSDAVYQIDPTSVYLDGDEYSISKIGFDAYIKLSHFISIFGEYLSKDKAGGYFVKSVLSDGRELPQDYPNYSSSGSYKYFKNVYFYNTSYKGDEFIVGAHIFISDILKEEISFKNEKTFFTPEFLGSVVPAIMTYNSISKFNFKLYKIPVKLDFEVRLEKGDENLLHYNYGIEFDENNFYNTTLAGCYKKITVRNESKVILFDRLDISLSVWFNRYHQHDIYFNNTDKWNSDTVESVLVADYKIDKKLNGMAGMRLKNYKYSDFIEKDAFYTFKKSYVNPYLGINYKAYKNVSLSIGYGIEPTIDEEDYDGFAYYLNQNISNNFPFFKDAEDKLSEQQFITLKGVVRF